MVRHETLERFEMPYCTQVFDSLTPVAIGNRVSALKVAILSDLDLKLPKCP